MVLVRSTRPPPSGATSTPGRRLAPSSPANRVPTRRAPSAWYSMSSVFMERLRSGDGFGLAGQHEVVRVRRERRAPIVDQAEGPVLAHPAELVLVPARHA